MIKKHAVYLSIALLVAPLVASADDMAVQPLNPVQMALLQLPQSCPALATGVDTQQQALLQAFYQAQNDQMVWTDPGRVAAL